MILLLVDIDKGKPGRKSGYAVKDIISASNFDAIDEKAILAAVGQVFGKGNGK